MQESTSPNTLTNWDHMETHSAICPVSGWRKTTEVGLQPAPPPESITVADVLRVMRSGDDIGGDRAEHARGVELVKSVLTELHAAERSSHANLHFADLVRRADSASD